MITVSKHEMARRLREEAERIRKHGLSNFSEHTYACLVYGQASKEKMEDRCGDCPNRPFVPAGFEEEAFPCQHITEEGWERASDKPGQAERTAEWLLRTAEELEREEKKPIKKAS